MNEPTRRIDRASRWIAARPESLYAAFVDADELRRWLPPRGARGSLREFDPRPGGAFRMDLVFEGMDRACGKTTENTDSVSGQFVSLVRDRRIALAIDFVSQDAAFAGTMTMTWEFVPEGDGTRVTITAADVPPGIAPTDHEVGMASSLQNLASLVEGISPD
jgi:uncharacterized protein YndB with AHSA1/START domain